MGSGAACAADGGGGGHLTHSHAAAAFLVVVGVAVDGAAGCGLVGCGLAGSGSRGWCTADSSAPAAAVPLSAASSRGGRAAGWRLVPSIPTLPQPARHRMSMAGLPLRQDRPRHLSRSGIECPSRSTGTTHSRLRLRVSRGTCCGRARLRAVGAAWCTPHTYTAHTTNR